jgi:uncharacterized protein
MTRIPGNIPYDLLRCKVQQADARIITRLSIGLSWITCKASLADKESHPSLGLAMTLGAAIRTLVWPGTIAGKSVQEVACWLDSWNWTEAAVGLAAVNAGINTANNKLLNSAQTLAPCPQPNLAVFEHFKPRLANQKIIIIGHYPGIQECLRNLDVNILERMPSLTDLPDTAAEFLLPKADWIFITATSLINKTFPRLAQLASKATTVLMGPSTPWLSEWADFGINYLAGVKVVSEEKAEQIAIEGGGVRLFEGGVTYAVVKID